MTFKKILTLEYIKEQQKEVAAREKEVRGGGEGGGGGGGGGGGVSEREGVSVVWECVVCVWRTEGVGVWECVVRVGQRGSGGVGLRECVCGFGSV